MWSLAAAPSFKSNLGLDHSCSSLSLSYPFWSLACCSGGLCPKLPTALPLQPCFLDLSSTCPTWRVWQTIMQRIKRGRESAREVFLPRGPCGGREVRSRCDHTKHSAQLFRYWSFEISMLEVLERMEALKGDFSLHLSTTNTSRAERRSRERFVTTSRQSPVL